MASTTTTSSDQLMNDQVETFIEFLLDTETTSEEAFSQAILEKNDLYHEQYQSNFEKVVDQKLQQWRSYEKERNTTTDRTKLNAGNIVSDIQFEIELEEEEEEEDSSSDSERKKTRQKSTVHEKDQVHQPIKQLNIYIDPIGQCKRLLQFLYYCQQDHKYLTDLYFQTLDYCVKNKNEQIGAIGFQQIALHFLQDVNDEDERQHVMKYLPSDLTSSTIPELHKPILSLIQTLLSSTTNESDVTRIIPSEYLDILYPYSARFLDFRREFRDSAHYFIDGDSLILSIAHHINIDLKSYHGNTLHAIFIIERLLLTLFNQTHRCNYTLIFFDCHYQCYQQEESILSLLRACLIAHLSRNANHYGSFKVKQFSSWLTNEYKEFASEEKPHFIFYHDISNFDRCQNSLLTKNTLKKLLYIYRLFGNYHQYYVQCRLLLMNKLILADTMVKCFQIKFTEKCSMILFTKAIRDISIDQINSETKRKDWIEFGKEICKITNQNDIRLFLYLKTIAELIEEDKDKDLFILLSPLLVLHVALLIRLSLIDRHLPANFASIEYSPIFSKLIIQFQQRLALSLSSYSSTLSWSKIADIFDGRLFAFTLYQLNQSSSTIYFDSNTIDMVKECLLVLNFPIHEILFHKTIEQLIQKKYISFSSSSEMQPAIVKQQQITKISNVFIDTLLRPILPMNFKPTFNFISPEESHLTRYEGKYHWHVYRRVGDEIERIPVDDGQDRESINYRFRTRRDQKFYSYFTLYGKSLTSPDVKDNQLQIVLPATSKATFNRINNQNDEDRSRSPHKTKAIIIKEKNIQRLTNKDVAEETRKMNNIEAELKQISSENYSDAIKLIDNCLSSFKISTNRLKLIKQKLSFQRKYLKTFRKKTNLTNEEKSKLDLLQVSYFATLTEIVNLENTKDPFNEKQKYMEELIDNSPLDLEKWYRFQLEKINSRLPRREQGQPDKRVPEIIPDEWQLEFLNAVDKRNSIIIVAPTASGKTYASYYAMDEILKDKKDPKGICVYVAPTKALVNQVAATIYSKLDAKLGIFTRDFRRNVDSCRILVTVPQCLEILLLSPTHYQDWCRRIKYVIFDEIHCMSGEIGSDVWEKTMLLINCPMIGLSATVNNGQEITNWIQHVENQRSRLFQTSQPRQVCFIVHHERAADLNKYLYSNGQLHPIHPVGVMNAKQLITRGVPKDFSLSPCETLQLNDEIQKTIANTEKVQPTEGVEENTLIPTLTEHFSPDWIIERNVCNRYSQGIRNQFDQLIDNKKDFIIDSIASSLKPIPTNDIHYPESKPILSLIIDFILTLREKNLLPCLVFSDNRKLCEDMAATIAKYFEEEEKHLRKTKYKSQIEALERRMKLIEKTRRKTESTKVKRTSNKGNNDKDDIIELNLTKEEENNQTRLSGFEQQLLNGILDEGTLANRHQCDRELVDALLERAGEDNPRLVRYMNRGVAYHHAGLNNKGRVAVEALFRNRYVQVVFSTATLAMGIHMPTKTVAFVKDSIYLDALQYRQASGRSGRRGFDVQGHVVFVDIPLSKIRHLMISAIPSIHAHFPTSVTFLMRLLNLCSNAENSTDAINRSLIALECPFLSQSPMKKYLIDIQTRFHCLFTLDFLYRLKLVNGQGDLIGLAGLLTHLYYYEPSNLLLVFLINNQLFHKIKDENEIITIFAYLFTNMPWLITHKKYEDLLEHRKKSKFNSKLFLPSISKRFRESVEAYNTIVKEVYGSYIDNVTRYLRSNRIGQEEILPFSNISFAQTSDYDNGSFEYNLHYHQSQQLQNPSISPFAGPSGLTHEYFMSNYNPLVGSWDLSYDLDLSPKIVPFVDIDCRDHTNTTYYLNSYALDFFIHGSEDQLIAENKLSSGDTYDLLLDFHLALSSINTSLKIILEDKETQTISDDHEFFLSLYKSIFPIQDIFSNRFYTEYPGRNRM